jgi:hypothetical protein
MKAKKTSAAPPTTGPSEMPEVSECEPRWGTPTAITAMKPPTWTRLRATVAAATTSPTTITQPTRKPAQTLGAGLLGGRAEEDVNAQP